MPSNHLILCHPLLLSSIFPSIRVFSNESVLCIRWPKYWSFSFSINPSNEYSGLISFRIDWASLIAQLVKNPPAMQETLVLFLGLSGRSPGEGKGYPFQYSGLKNSMDWFPCGSPGKESTCNAGDPGLIPGLGRSPGEGTGYPFQYSGLKNSVDYIVHGVAKSQT